MERKIDINYLERRLKELTPEGRDRIYKHLDKTVCELYGTAIGAVSGILAASVLYPNIDNEDIATKIAAVGLMGLAAGAGNLTGRLISYFRNRKNK